VELRQLRQFVAVCRAGSLTRAGAELHLAQQSLSATVAALEAELGVQLLERGAFGVRVTAAGRVLHDRAGDLLAAADAAARAAQRAGGYGPGTVAVRYGLDCEHLVGPLLAHVRREAPELAVSGWTAPDADNLAAVRGGEADVAFAWALDRAAPDLARATVGEETCVAAVPAGHPLAGAGAVPVEALAGRELVMFPRAAAAAVHDHIAAHFAADGRLAPRMTDAAMSGQAGLVDAAAASGAIAPVSLGLVAGLRRPDVRFLPWAPPLTVPLHVAWRPGAGAATARFVDAVTAAAAPGPDGQR